MCKSGEGPAPGQAGRLEHLALAERAARGKAERTLVPLSALGEWRPSSDRPNPARLLEEQATSRVPELVPSVTAECWSRRSPSTGVLPT